MKLDVLIWCMTCFPEKFAPCSQRLLRIASQTISTHTRTVSEIIHQIADPKRKPNAKEFAALRNDMRDAFLNAQASGLG
ncbi:MAG TPA: hypothetical protein VFB14_18295 [Bryobacteraceae bacterium]|jgi:hypothetical protein|nr:hypothetical protein [Bryobacteraceae bacterium]